MRGDVHPFPRNILNFEGGRFGTQVKLSQCGASELL